MTSSILDEGITDCQNQKMTPLRPSSKHSIFHPIILYYISFYYYSLLLLIVSLSSDPLSCQN